ncbi:MAG TPA: glycosyltransferase family 39 protein [Pseudolabrys sp.]|nr:glycosyltransferase family 39 protein [Pseudolabrys sp.]
MSKLGRFLALDRIADDPQRALAVILLMHAGVWTLLPSLLYPNLPLDLIEALTYGREWQLGYDKLPPLPWWLVEIVYRAVGHDFAYYLLAQAAVVLALWLVWLTARPLTGPLGALVAVLIADGLHYFNYTAAKFNHDVIQLPFWALAGFAFHRALRGGRMGHWLLLGLAVGASLWAKYFVVVLAIPLFFSMLLDSDARKALRTPGPYLAAVAALLIASPHLVWLVRNDFLPFAYAEHRAIPSRGLIDHLWHPLQFLLGQAFFLIPSAIIAAPLFFPREKTGMRSLSFDQRIVICLAFGPATAVIALSALTGRGTVAMWGYPLWLFLGVFLVMASRQLPEGRRLARVLTSWWVVFVGLVVAFIVNYALLPRYDHRYRAVFFPGSNLARELSERYRSATGRPIFYVIGSMWVAGNIAHYAPEHPRVLIDGKPERAPWIDLSDLRTKGAIVVWTAGDLNAVPVGLRTVAADASVQPPFLLRYLRGDSSLYVGWAILHPRPSFARYPAAVAR